MLIKDVIDDLRFGELSGANLGENEIEGVSPFNYEKLVNYINSALTELHSRLPLQIREVLLEQKSGITLYKMHSDFAKSNATSTQPVKYLNDLADHFDDRLLKIDEVYNEVGIELVLDNLNDQKSLFRPSPTTLQIPYPVDGQIISIVYRSNHKKLVYSGDESVFLNQEINLPTSYLSAITSFVLYKHKKSFDTTESAAEAVNSYRFFELQISNLLNFGLTPEDNLVSNKLEINGWV